MKRRKYWISSPTIAALGLMLLSSASAEDQTWILTQTFLGPTAASDGFSHSIAISDNNVLIGAYRDDAGDEDSGAAYLFDAITGNLLQTFLNPTPDRLDFFGISVGISGNNVLIGASGDDAGESLANTGAAYLFDAVTGNLLQTFFHPTPTAFYFFGAAVAISGNNVLIGSENDGAGGENSGAAYLFDAGTGNLLQTFLNPTAAFDDRFPPRPCYRSLGFPKSQGSLMHRRPNCTSVPVA